jgi:ABC-type polysaccharide/polyol phosphate transport system ATPase subunit
MRTEYKIRGVGINEKMTMTTQILTFVFAIVIVNSYDIPATVLKPRPSSIAAVDATLKYPVSIMSRLFSSVPKREYAVERIHLSFGHVINLSSSLVDGNDGGIILLVGRSASGKSSLLRLLAGIEMPTNDGRIIIEGSARPVILDCKPDFDDSLNVMDRIVQVGVDAAIIQTQKIGLQNNISTTKEDLTLLRKLAEDIVSLLMLSNEQLLAMPSELCPSIQYLLGIACACMTSMALQCIHDPIGAQDDGIYYPIILMDELFDTEHPSIAENCGKGILNLVRAGGVVISATHRPGHFRGTACRTITLSGGKVLADERIVLHV